MDFFFGLTTMAVILYAFFYPAMTSSIHVCLAFSLSISLMDEQLIFAEVAKIILCFDNYDRMFYIDKYGLLCKSFVTAMNPMGFFPGIYILLLSFYISTLIPTKNKCREKVQPKLKISQKHSEFKSWIMVDLNIYI